MIEVFRGPNDNHLMEGCSRERDICVKYVSTIHKIAYTQCMYCMYMCIHCFHCRRVH